MGSMKPNLFRAERVSVHAGTTNLNAHILRPEFFVKVSHFNNLVKVRALMCHAASHPRLGLLLYGIPARSMVDMFKLTFTLRPNHKRSLAHRGVCTSSQNSNHYLHLPPRLLPRSFKIHHPPRPRSSPQPPHQKKNSQARSEKTHRKKVDAQQSSGI